MIFGLNILMWIITNILSDQSQTEMQLSTSHTAAIAILENSQLQHSAPSNEERARGLPIQLNLHVMLSGDLFGIFFLFLFSVVGARILGGKKRKEKLLDV